MNDSLLEGAAVICWSCYDTSVAMPTCNSPQRFLEAQQAEKALLRGIISLFFKQDLCIYHETTFHLPPFSISWLEISYSLVFLWRGLWRTKGYKQEGSVC